MQFCHLEQSLRPTLLPLCAGNIGNIGDGNNVTYNFTLHSYVPFFIFALTCNNKTKFRKRHFASVLASPYLPHTVVSELFPVTPSPPSFAIVFHVQNVSSYNSAIVANLHSNCKIWTIIILFALFTLTNQLAITLFALASVQ